MKIVRNETFSYFIPYQKKKQVKFFSKKTFLFPFKKQAEITKFSGGLRPPNPPQVSLKISLEPLRPRGGVSCVCKYGKVPKNKMHVAWAF